jgi:predicted HNH restriction endonuclease
MKRIITSPIKVQSKDGRIIGEYLPDGKIKVSKGSFFRNIEVNSVSQRARNERMFLLNNGYIKNNQLAKDYVFDNPSLAVSALMGHMASGNQTFVTIDNIELGSYLVTDPIVNYEQQKLMEFIKELGDNKNQDFDIRTLLDDADANHITTNDILKEVIESVVYEPKIKQEKVISEKSAYARDPEIAKRCIVLSNYKCNLDGDHESFITKKGKPYMEAHHLIPISYQDYFDYSLDVEANIISLCPNCHRKLHYGSDIKSELEKIYKDRIQNLRKSGLDISIEELFKIYGLDI